MPSNIGNQDVTLLYFTIANSREVNKRFQDIRQLGIYSGGRLAIVDATNAQLSPLVCEISDGTYQVKVETTTAVNFEVVEATPYVVLRWTYTGATSDYMEILIVATPASDDLVVGKCSFGAGILIGFDYGDTSYPRSTPNTQDLFLKVEPTENTELKVRIRAGRVQNDSGVLTISDQKSTLFVAPTANSKIYLLYIRTSDGTVQIDSSGTEAASPVAPNYGGKMVLAEITLASTDTNITMSKIKDVRNFISKSIEPDDSTIGVNIDGKLYVKSNAIEYSMLANVYDSGWFTCTIGGTYIKDHNLGSVALIVQVLYASDSGGSPDLSNVQIEYWHHDIGNETGVKVVNITNTQLTVQTGASGVAFYPDSSGNDLPRKTTGHYRVLAMRIA